MIYKYLYGCVKTPVDNVAEWFAVENVAIFVYFETN